MTSVASKSLTLQSKSITVPDPTDLEEITLFRANAPAVIQKIVAVLIGSTPSVTWTIKKSSDRSSAGTEVITGGTTTTSNTSGAVITVFNSPAINADEFVWLETSAIDGLVDELHLTIFFS
jgi:hypothetical protein